MQFQNNTYLSILHQRKCNDQVHTDHKSFLSHQAYMDTGLFWYHSYHLMSQRDHKSTLHSQIQSLHSKRCPYSYHTSLQWHYSGMYICLHCHKEGDRQDCGQVGSQCLDCSSHKLKEGKTRIHNRAHIGVFEHLEDKMKCSICTFVKLPACLSSPNNFALIAYRRSSFAVFLTHVSWTGLSPLIFYKSPHRI